MANRLFMMGLWVTDCNNYDQPTRPNDAMYKMSINMADAREFSTVERYNVANGIYLNKCEVLFKGSLSTALQMHTEGINADAYQTGSSENLEMFRAEFMARHGGCTEAQGQANWEKTNAIGAIFDVESADKAF